MCASMMSELLSTERLTSSDAGGQRLDTKPIDDALHRCLALHKRRRITSDELHDVLVTFLLDNEKRSPCLARVGLEPNPIYMDVEHPLQSQ
jgi:hypothetical protein